MLARDLKPGDEIGTWTVVRVFEVCGVTERVVEQSAMVYSNGEPLSVRTVERNPDPWSTVVLVKLERGIPDPATKQTWFLADEEVGL